jgi:hypothetical protein
VAEREAVGGERDVSLVPIVIASEAKQSFTLSFFGRPDEIEAILVGWVKRSATHHFEFEWVTVGFVPMK